jgi:hypothetical protein
MFLIAWILTLSSLLVIYKQTVILKMKEVLASDEMEFHSILFENEISAGENNAVIAFARKIK